MGKPRGKEESIRALLCTEKRKPNSTAPTPIEIQPAMRKTAATEAVIDEGSRNEGATRQAAPNPMAATPCSRSAVSARPCLLSGFGSVFELFIFSLSPFLASPCSTSHRYFIDIPPSLANVAAIVFAGWSRILPSRMMIYNITGRLLHCSAKGQKMAYSDSLPAPNGAHGIGMPGLSTLTGSVQQTSHCIFYSGSCLFH